MPDGRVDVVLFDLGGVLMNFGGLGRLATLAKQQLDDALESRWCASPYVQAFERGECTADTFAEQVVADFDLNLSPAAFIDDFRRWSAGPFPGAVDLVRSLHDTEQIGCLSNTNAVHWQQHLDRWGLVEHFDWRFTSHQLGTMKPDPAIYEHVIRAINIAPERVLFLDDSLVNVQAARFAGMQAEHTRGLHEVQEALKAHLSAWNPPPIGP